MALTNVFNVPLPLAVWLATDEYKPGNKPLEISATGLLKSPRYILANLRTNNPELFDESIRLVPEEEKVPDIQERVAARIGTAIHSSVERAWSDYYKQAMQSLGLPEKTRESVNLAPYTSNTGINVYMENRMFKEIEVEGITFTISGQYDMVINGELHDIKTTSTYSYESGINDSKYIEQGSIYRWLDPNLITGDELTINFVFLDFKQYLGKKEGNYPPARVYFKKYRLMSVMDTEMFIRNKLKRIVQYWNMPLEQIPCCEPRDLFRTPTVYKYYKSGFVEGKKSTKNFSSLAEANRYKSEQGFKGDIIEDRGKPFMCPYCIEAEVEQMTRALHKHKVLEIG